jgi:hypothetical protein
LGLGVTVTPRANLTLYGGYHLQVSARQNLHAGSAGLHWAW